MQDEIFAAIDLGTNTFHILIVKKEDNHSKFEVLFKERHYVYLGRNGVDSISEESFILGLETILKFKYYLNKYGVSKYRMIGTAALRSASNGPEFLFAVKEKTDLDIEIIEGEREADLIYKGVKSYLGATNESNLIMDIGGGSVEFILFDSTGKKWAKSFKIGISVLYNSFQKSDPINKQDLESVHQFLEEQLKPLIIHFENINIDALVGSAGSFEVVVGVLQKHFGKEISREFSSDKFQKIYDEILPISYDERLSYPGIPEARARLIPMGLILIAFILNKLKIKRVIVSPYALKEGVISELIQD